jgi:hypothetical protein
MPRGPRRIPVSGAVAAGAAIAGAAALVLAGCAGASHSAPSSSARAVHGVGPLAAPAPGNPAAGKGTLHGLATPGAKLDLAAQSIIYTASLTVRAADVASAADRAAAIAMAAGGYVSSEQESVPPGRHSVTFATLQLKIPVSAYPAALARLSRLGIQTALAQQAQDVTQQVADVTSRVASARAAIAQLRALLAHAGSVSQLLSVQNEINSEESDLESLLAQQRALSRETSYATVTLTLIAQHVPHARKKHPAHHGFLTGLGAGWRALRAVTTALLTALGAVLPFTALLAVLAALGYAWWRRLRGRRAGPAAPGSAAPGSPGAAR